MIKKTSETTPTMASVVNATNSSTTDAYSCDYVNEAIQDVYSTTETKTNKVWIDGKPIYRKVVQLSNVGRGYIAHNHGITNVDKLITMVGILDDGSTGIRYLPNVSCDNITLYGASLTDFKKTGTFNTLFGTSIGTTNSVVAIFEYTKTTD